MDKRERPLDILCDINHVFVPNRIKAHGGLSTVSAPKWRDGGPCPSLTSKIGRGVISLLIMGEFSAEGVD